MKRFLVLFCVGFILGPLGDYTHVLSHTLGYPQGKFLFYIAGTPYWVFFLFASAAVMIGFSHPQGDRLLKANKPRRGAQSGLGVVLGLAAFIGVYAISGYLPWPPSGLSFWILAGLSLLVWVLFEGTWQGLLLAALTAVVGTCVEMLLVWHGDFFYLPRAASFFGVPSWLPWLYVAASVAVGNLGRFLATPHSLAIKGAEKLPEIPLAPSLAKRK